MSSTASQVDIYNMALARIGESASLTAVSDTTHPANMCNLFWPTARDTVLQSRMWAWATRRQALSAIAKASPDNYANWTYRYVVPTEALQVVAVLPPPDGSATSQAREPSDGADYRIVSSGAGDRDLYTDQEDAVLEYIERVADETLYSPQFVQAAVCMLAHHLAPAIIKGAKGEAVARQMLKDAAGWIEEASANDAAQSQDLEDAPFSGLPDHLAGR